MPRPALALAALAVTSALRAPPSLAARKHAADAAAAALGGNPIDLSVPSMMAGSMPPSMVAGGAAQETYDGVRIGPPPDLPSLLLSKRIVSRPGGPGCPGHSEWNSRSVPLNTLLM